MWMEGGMQHLPGNFCIPPLCPGSKDNWNLHHFVTADISITILSCNSFNSQNPINVFASWHVAHAIPYADPERAQTVLLIDALLFITNPGIFSSPPPFPQTKNPDINLFQSNSTIVPTPYLLSCFLRWLENETLQKIRPSSIEIVSCGVYGCIFLLFSSQS